MHEHMFWIFYVPKFSEMLQNTPKKYIGSNGLEGMLPNFGTPKYCTKPRNTCFASSYMPKVSKMLRTTPKIILNTME
jgi:hypothetical protein